MLCAGQGWRPKQIFPNGKGFWHGQEKCSCYLDFKHFLKILLRGRKKPHLNQVKSAASLLKNETCLCCIPASLEETRGKGTFKRREIKRLVVFAKAMSAGFSDSLDCIYNIWPCAELQSRVNTVVELQKLPNPYFGETLKFFLSFSNFREHLLPTQRFSKGGWGGGSEKLRLSVIKAAHASIPTHGEPADRTVSVV